MIRSVLFRSTLWLFTLTFALSVYAQFPTNFGTDFWLAHMGHNDATESNFDVHITSRTATSGVIEIPLLGWSQAFTVLADSFVSIRIPSNVSHVSCEDCKESRGVHISSLDNISVYANISYNARTEAALIYPTHILGNEYYAMCYNRVDRKTEFIVIATEDNTNISITPSANTMGGNPAGFAYAVALKRGEVYQVQSWGDLTGSRILSYGDNKKSIAVFSGSPWTNVWVKSACGTTSDNLIEQMFPVNVDRTGSSSLGQEFIGIPSINRSTEVYRALAVEDNTSLSINGATPITLAKGAFYETKQAQPVYFNSNKPLIMAQFSITSSCDGLTMGDPFMMVMNPLNYKTKNIYVHSAKEDSIEKNYITVLMKIADTTSFRLDNKPINFGVVASKPEYAYAIEEVGFGNHSLFADSGFIASAYGYGHIESYGYMAGFQVDPKPLAIATTQVNTCSCVGTITAKATGGEGYYSYKWSNNATTATISNLCPGDYTVTVTDSGFLGVKTIQKTVTIVLSTVPTSTFNLGDTVCPNESSTVIYTGNAKSGSVYQWDFDGATVVSGTGKGPYLVKWPSTGSKKISLQVVDNGCPSVIYSDSIFVKNWPTLSFTLADEVCIGKETEIDYTGNASVNASYTWTLDGAQVKSGAGKGPLQVQWNSSGIKQIGLQISQDGCTSNWALDSILVERLPIALFNFSTDSLFVSFRCKDTTGITSWYWDYGDRSPIGNKQNVEHTYAQLGEFPITLIVGNKCGFDTLVYLLKLDGSKQDSGSSTGISVGTFRNKINLYPNPFRDKIYLYLEDNFQEVIQIEMFDYTGRRIYHEERIVKSNMEYMEFNIAANHLENKLVVLRIQGNNLNQSFRLFSE